MHGADGAAAAPRRLRCAARPRRRPGGDTLRFARFPGCAAALAAACLAPAAAQAAPTLIPLTKCARYADLAAGHRYVPVAGRGFTPGGSVRIGYSGGDLGGYASTDASGDFATKLFAPSSFIPTDAGYLRTYRLTAVDQSNPGPAASASLRFVRLAVRVPQRSRPHSVVTYRLYGFPNRTTYAHYWFGGRRRATVRLGRPTGPCGLLRRRMRYLPARVHYGEWDVYFTSRRRFTKADARRRRYVLRGSFTVWRSYRLHRLMSAANPGGQGAGTAVAASRRPAGGL